MDVTADKISDILFIKHTFDENESCVLLQVYLADTPANSDSVRINCTETLLRVEYLNNSSPHENCRTWSRWQVTLRGRIIPDKSSYKITPNRSRVSTQRWAAKLDIQLRKQEPVKWVNLEANKSASDIKPDSIEEAWQTLANESSSTVVRNSVSSPKKTESATKGTSSTTKNGSNAASKAVGKKPFCLVSPNNAQTTTFAGYTGIENLKNCCFMNAVLQILANTRAVRDFAAQFDIENEAERGTKRPRIDVKAERAGAGKVTARCELLRELCAIVNDLWAGTQSYVTPLRFKTLFSARFAQFAGSLQQDSHEFLTFLLDGIRDELKNRIAAAADTANSNSLKLNSDSNSNSNSSYNVTDASDSSNLHQDPNVATNSNESLAFLNSFLGELCSEIRCLQCEQVSTRRDAFFCLSVPIPKPAARVRIYFMSYVPTERPRPLDIELPASSDERAPCALNVLRHVANEMRCRIPDLRMYEVHQGRFHRLFTPHSALDELAPGDQLVVQQVVAPDADPPRTEDSQFFELMVTQRVLMPNAQFDFCCNCQRSCADVQGVMKKCTRCYRVAYCSRECQLSHYEEHKSWCRYVPALVGCPFILTVPRALASFEYVNERMLQYAQWSVEIMYRTPPPPLPSSSQAAVNAQHTSGGSTGLRSTIEGERDIPALLSPPVDDSSNDNDDDLTEANDSQSNSRRKFMFVVKEANEHGLETGRVLAPTAAGSDAPLDLTGWKYVYMDWLNKERNRPYVIVQSKPSLDPDAVADANGAGGDVASSSLKTSASVYDCLSSFTECEMLHAAEAWRCPRCDNLQAASKQLTISHAPDILVVHLKRFKPNREKLDVIVDFPVLALDISKFVLRDVASNSSESSSEFVYDLYATVNHFGVTSGGHYTAYARLADATDSTRNEFGWREFDDLSVKVLHDVNIVRSRHAYLLFFKRRTQPPSSPTA